VSAADTLRTIVDALDAARIPHMLVGSFASSVHGAPRTTQDIDLVIDPTPGGLRRFATTLESAGYYVSPSALDALDRRDQFNAVDPVSGWKVDLMIRKERPFSRSEFDRRIETQVLGARVWLATSEDTVLAKLEWAAMGASDRQVADAATVLAVRGEAIDQDYLDRWAEELGVQDLLARARQPT
jgi:Uncharacterised nucleotidyltransferase